MFDIQCRSRTRGDTSEGKEDLSVKCSISNSYYPVLSYNHTIDIRTCTLSFILSIIGLRFWPVHPAQSPSQAVQEPSTQSPQFQSIHFHALRPMNQILNSKAVIRFRNVDSEMMSTPPVVVVQGIEGEWEYC